MALIERTTANLVLQDTVERIFVQRLYADIPRGIFIVRGENVVLLGEIVRPRPPRRIRSGAGLLAESTELTSSNDRTSTRTTTSPNRIVKRLSSWSSPFRGKSRGSGHERTRAGMASCKRWASRGTTPGRRCYDF